MISIEAVGTGSLFQLPIIPTWSWNSSLALMKQLERASELLAVKRHFYTKLSSIVRTTERCSRIGHVWPEEHNIVHRNPFIENFIEHLDPRGTEIPSIRAFLSLRNLSGKAAVDDSGFALSC